MSAREENVETLPKRVATCPVINFDHHSLQYAENWKETFKEMHSKCPIARTETYGGFWVVADYQSVRDVTMDPETYSSDHDLENVRKGGQGILIPPLPYALALSESDPPLSTQRRKIEVPFFTPRAIKAQHARIQQHVDGAIDAVIESGKVEMIDQIALPISAKTTMELVGIDLEHWEEFALPAHLMSFLPSTSPDYPTRQIQQVMARLYELTAARRAEPTGDIVTALTKGVVQGKLLTDDEIVSMLSALVFAGFDTTTSAIGSALFWLSAHPETHEGLLQDAAKMDNAVEEFLRAFPPSHGVARNIAKETTILGQPLKTGERVYVSWAAANYDPKKFESPEEIQLDRKNAAEHLSFGAGGHRCLGAGLAKADIVLVLTAVLARMKNLRIDPSTVIPYESIGGVAGFKAMPATFSPALRLQR